MATAMGNSSISNGNGNNIKRVYTMSDQLICQLLGGTDAYTHTHTHTQCLWIILPCTEPPPAGGHAVAALAAVTAGQCTAGMPQRLSLSTIAGWPPRYCCGFLFTVFREAQAEKESLHSFRCAPAVIIQYSCMMSGKGRQGKGGSAMRCWASVCLCALCARSDFELALGWLHCTFPNLPHTN